MHSKAAKWVTALVVTIMVIGFAESYRSMAEFLHSNAVEAWASWTIPATVDMLALAATISRHILPKSRYALFVALASVSASVAANVGGAPNVIAGASHAWPIVAYLLGEGLVVRLLAVKVEAPIVAPAAVEIVAPAPAKATRTRKPRGDYGPRGEVYAASTKRAKAAAARAVAVMANNSAE